MNIDSIKREALSLPANQRAQLAEQLLASLDDLTEEEVEQLWFAEAERRAGELTSGLVERIPAEVVNEEADSLLK